MKIKEVLTQTCESYVEERILKLENAIADLEEALKLETKCSMGDKYETSRAMLHLEFEKLSAQYHEARKLRKTIRLINTASESSYVTFGSIVETSGVNYFIAVPAGEIAIQKERYFTIGAGSPIAKALMGKKAGDHLDFNGRKLEITAVY